MRQIFLAAAVILSAASARALETSASIPNLSVPAAMTLAAPAQLPVLPAAISAVNAAEAISPLSAPQFAPAAAAPQVDAMRSIVESGVIQASSKGGDTAALSASEARLFDNSFAKTGNEAPVAAPTYRSRVRGFLGKAAATVSAVAAVPALAQAQTQAPSTPGDSTAFAAIFLGLMITAIGYMAYESADFPERKKAKAYIAKNGAAIRALPGVTKVKVETVMTSPWSSAPGVAIYYGLGADRAAIQAGLPPTVGVNVSIMAAYSEKEAARDYVAKAGEKIRAIPGVVDVKAGSIDEYAYIAGSFSAPAVIVRYGQGADLKAIEAAVPPAENGVRVVLEPR